MASVIEKKVEIFYLEIKKSGRKTAVKTDKTNGAFVQLPDGSAISNQYHKTITISEDLAKAVKLI